MLNQIVTKTISLNQETVSLKTPKSDIIPEENNPHVDMGDKIDASEYHLSTPTPDDFEELNRCIGDSVFSFTKGTDEIRKRVYVGDLDNGLTRQRNPQFNET